MQHQDCFAVVDCTFHDLLKVDQLFGGIPVGALKSGLCLNPPRSSRTARKRPRSWLAFAIDYVAALDPTSFDRKLVLTWRDVATESHLCSLSVTVVVDPTLCGATSLPPYVKVYDDCAEFYSTFFPPGVIVMARETPELFAKSAILASHNTSRGQAE